MGMNNKCTRCHKELNSMYDYGLCYDCKAKDDRDTFLLGTGLLLAVFVVLIGLRFVWAEVVYQDWRCALSECRILKD